MELVIDNNSGFIGDHVFSEPIPIITRTGPKFVIEHILQHHWTKNGGFKFEVKWCNFPDSVKHNKWMMTTQLQHTIALDKYLTDTGLTSSQRHH